MPSKESFCFCFSVKLKCLSTQSSTSNSFLHQLPLQYCDSYWAYTIKIPFSVALSQQLTSLRHHFLSISVWIVPEEYSLSISDCCCDLKSSNLCEPLTTLWCIDSSMSLCSHLRTVKQWKPTAQHLRCRTNFAKLKLSKLNAQPQSQTSGVSRGFQQVVFTRLTKPVCCTSFFDNQFFQNDEMVCIHLQPVAV